MPLRIEGLFIMCSNAVCDAPATHLFVDRLAFHPLSPPYWSRRMVWYGMVWHGVVWYGMIALTLRLSPRLGSSTIARQCTENPQKTFNVQFSQLVEIPEKAVHFRSAPHKGIRVTYANTFETKKIRQKKLVDNFPPQISDVNAQSPFHRLPPPAPPTA